MQKKYIVRLSEEERSILKEIIKKLKGTSQRVRRSQILLKADADGPNWTDQKIAEAFDCRRQTVENIRESLVTNGFEIALNGKKRETPPRKKLLDGEHGTDAPLYSTMKTRLEKLGNQEFFKDFCGEK